MTKSMKKPEFLYPFARLTVDESEDAYASVPFLSSDSFGDEEVRALAAPSSWSGESVALMAEAACQNIPFELRTIEENTIPSWLWRRQGKGTRRARETDLRDIFNRAVGSAVAKAWKLSLFTTEKHARTFYDEARNALMQRHITLLPEIIAPWGLSWAYGIENVASPSSTSLKLKQTRISNAAIDAMIGKKKDATLWKKLFTTQNKKTSSITLRLQDIASDWYSFAPNPARAAIDVLAMRHNDGTINIDALRQGARVLTLLLDLHDRSDVTISLVNIAPLLLALGLAYDSDAARAMTASLVALVTAECTATSAEMSALRGASKVFIRDREAIMRGLRNHRRAVYGDTNDYERLSVLPTALSLKNCPDLALVSETQRRWDDALHAAQAFGLRTVQATDLTPAPALALLMTSASQGLEPMQSLSVLHSTESGQFQSTIHPAVGEAMTRLGYPRATTQALDHHIIGTHTLVKAPAINHKTLRAHGLSDAAIEKIEAYLPCVSSLRLAITPWIIGVDYCLHDLKISPKVLHAPNFDLLKHLGFEDEDIAMAETHCYGFGTARNAKIVHLQHRSLFAYGAEVSSKARLRMAAAVQSFISGDTGIALSLPQSQSIISGGESTLSAWKAGLKSLTIVFDKTIEGEVVREPSLTTRRIKASPHSRGKAFRAPPRYSKNGKTTVLSVKKSRAAHKSH